MRQSFLRQVIEKLLAPGGFLAQGGLISLRQLTYTLDAERERVRATMGYLIRQGAVSIAHSWKSSRPSGRGPFIKEVTYAISRQKLAELLKKPSLKPLSGWERMYRTVRAMKRFTRDDLCQLADVKRNNAEQYTKKLREKGLIRYQGKGTWLLIKDPGPRRPV